MFKRNTLESFSAGVLAAGMLVCGGMLSLSAKATVKLGTPFADHMVLQRDRPVAVWGIADPGEKVTVSFAGQTVTATADAAGDWRCDLKPMAASAEPRALTANDFKVEDVLVGEVWFAGGQSNMDFPITMPDPRHCEEKGTLVAQYVRRPLVRYAKYNANGSTVPRHRFGKATGRVTWKDFRYANVRTIFDAAGKPHRGISAVAYYFALALHDELRIPIGIIQSTRGGTNIEAWTPRAGFAAVPGLEVYNEKYPVEPAKWSKADVRGVIKSAGRQPGWLWNGLVAPLAPYTIRGVIWYQGCANASDWQHYTTLSHALYRGWTKAFENPQMPFLFAQLCPWGDAVIPHIQEAQAQFAAEEPNAWMSVNNDVGNLYDIHPSRKEIVAQRMLLHALKRVYGYAEIQDNSPTVESWKIDGNRFRVKFRDAKKLYVYNDDRSTDAGFEVAGADGIWHKAEIENLVSVKRKGKPDKDGTISGTELIISSKDVAKPVSLRFLHSSPWKGALYNEANLPVGAFHLPVPDFSRGWL